jgi:trk system potassium uptake protein TrkA
MKNVLIIGMSNFGYFLTRELVKNGADVMAVDLDEDKIERIKPYARKAIVADATDKEALKSFGIDSYDCVVVCLGHIEASVLAALHLKELNCPRLVAMAVGLEHGKILEMIGADDVVFPEKDFAARMAQKLVYENILNHIQMADGYSIIEMAPPASFLGKTLGQIHLRRKYNVQVIVIKEIVPRKVVGVPTADYMIKDSDILVMLGQDDDLAKVRELQ